MHVTLHNADGMVTNKQETVQASGVQYPAWLERVGWAVVGALGLNAAVGVAILAVLLQGVN